MGMEVAETLAQVDAQVEMGVQCGDWSSSGSEIPPLAVVGQENGVRVSAEGEEGKVGVVTEIVAEVSVETEVVETQIVAERVVVEGDGLVVEEASNIEEVLGSTLENGNGDKEVKCLVAGDPLLVEEASNTDEVLASKHEIDVGESGNGDKEVNCMVDGDLVVLGGDASGNMVELEQNGLSLVVEFHCPADRVDDSREDGEKGSVAEKGGAKEEKLTESQVTESMLGENGDMKGEGDCKQKDKGPVAEKGGAEEKKLAGDQVTEGILGENGDTKGEGECKQKDTPNGEEGKDHEVEDKGPVAEKGGAEDQVTEGMLGENGDTNGEGECKKKDTPNGGEGKDHEVDADSEDEEDGESDEDHDYRVGDFVWGKIRSHPWWPGRIYDPSDASVYASKLKTKGLLVAYFGDGSFSWCYPSQLKPFADGFDKMSKQSNSKIFLNAVKEALDEIHTIAELNMICSCVPEKDRSGLARPSVANAGIKPGVLVPECNLSRLTGLEDGPTQFIASLRNVAEAGRHTNMLEFAVLKGWLSAFCRAKGGYKQAIYHEPQYIEGLEDKNRNGATNLTDFSAPVEVPFQGPSEEDWLSLPLRDGSGQPVLRRCHIADDKLYHRRKKSVADLMNEEVVDDSKGKKGKVRTTKESTDSDKLVSISGKRKMKSSEVVVQSQDGNTPTSPSARKRERKKADTVETSKPRENDGNGLTSSSGRKRGRKNAEISETSKSKERSVLNTENGGSESEEEAKREKLASVEDVDKKAKEESKGASASRERKKSKYLSPPFTDPTSPPRKVSSKKRNEEISEMIRKVARMGERMTKVAERLIGSSPVTKSSDETEENPTSHPPEENHVILDSVKNKSMKEVVSEVRAAALNPSFGLDSVDGKFIQAFRSSVYQEGEKRKSSSSMSELPEEAKSQHTSNEKNEETKSGDRKLRSRKPELLEKVMNQTEPMLLEPETPKATNDTNELAKARKKRTSSAGKGSNDEKNGEVMEPGSKRRKSSRSKPELLEKDQNQTEHTSNDKSGKRSSKKSGEASKTKKSGKDISEEGSSPPWLIVSFPPVFVLPTKDDIIRIFKKYGPLNEKETIVLYNSFSAKVVFLKTSDAEEACNSSAEEKHFGNAKVHYRLQYPPGASNAASQRTPPPPKTATPVKPPAASSSSHGPAADEVTSLLYVKEKLELMTSMLAKSEGNISPELKSNLEGEMEGLLQKVKSSLS